MPFFTFAKKPLLYTLISFVLSLTIFSGINAQSSRFNLKQTPNWVTEIKPTTPSVEQSNNDGSGYYYLLVDKQEQIEQEEYFYHYAIQILNNEGISEASDISLDFDPEYQELAIHYINIIREGKTINKLSKNNIRLVQRETNLERKLYDGRLTAVANLSDIRQGDIVEYAYSIIGNNPIFLEKYDSRIYFSFSIPIEQLHHKLIYSTKRNLNFKYLNNAPKPKTESINQKNIYTWDIKKIEPLLIDINTPSWYDPYPYVDISEYKSWESIANRYAQLYKLSTEEKEILKNKISAIIPPDPYDSIIVKSIRFVQDEIRYLGFENGLNSHKPDNPLNVLKNRYGDCKAKSFLLCEMLKVNEIDASPVLVNSYRGNTIDNNLPSPNLFDHCVVEINYNDKYIYVDPTFSSQGGELTNIYFPDYKRGLVLKNGTNSLVDLPHSDQSSTEVKESFKLDKIDGKALLHVYTIYKGKDADSQRGYLASNTKTKIQKAYIDFYSTLYPTIDTTSEISFIDYRGIRNEIIVEEFYKIDSFWLKSDENDKLLYSEIYPLSFETYVKVDQSPTRSMPYRLGFPINYKHKSIIKLPEEWNANNENKIIESDDFQYEYDLSYNKNNYEIKITHEYKTLSDNIKPENVSSFISKHDDIIDNLSFILTYDQSHQVGTFKFSWFSGIISLLVLFICTYYSFHIYQNYDIPINTTNIVPEPIGGWLILVGIGVVLTPIYMTVGICTSPDYFDEGVMNYYLNFDNNLRQFSTGILLISELVLNIFFIVFSVLIAVLFFNKRTILPKLIIIFLAINFIQLALDTFFALKLNPTLYVESEKQEFYMEITRSAIRAAIWIPYFLVSKRVKKTFVAKSNKNVEKEFNNLEQEGGIN